MTYVCAREEVAKLNVFDWLRERLPPGTAAECDGIRKDAKAAGYTKRELKLARRALGVKTYHDYDEEDGLVQQWFWCREAEDQDAGS